MPKVSDKYHEERKQAIICAAEICFANQGDDLEEMKRADNLARDPDSTRSLSESAKKLLKAARAARKSLD